MRYAPRQDEPTDTGRLLARIQMIKQGMDRLFLVTGYFSGILFTVLAFFIT